jgi:hypothetical protein
MNIPPEKLAQAQLAVGGCILVSIWIWSPPDINYDLPAIGDSHSAQW